MGQYSQEKENECWHLPINVLIYCGKCREGEDLPPVSFRECPVGARTYEERRIVAPEQISWIFSREVRVSPLQRLSAGQAGIQVVPRILFALRRSQGDFLLSVLKQKLKQKE